MWWEFAIFLVCLLTLFGVCFAVFILREVVKRKDVEILDLHAALQNVTNSQRELVNETSKAKSESLTAFRDLETLIRMQKIIWDSRDTKAAENCVKRLIASGTSVNQLSVSDCYNQLRDDLGLSGWDALDL